jgi:hypothetical protein
LAAGTTALAAPTARSHAPARTAWRPHFLGSDFAVFVLVQLQERFGGVPNFLGGERAITIRIEGFHERMLGHFTGPAHATFLWAATRPLAGRLRKSGGGHQADHTHRQHHGT